LKKLVGEDSKSGGEADRHRFLGKKISTTFLHDWKNKLILKVEGVSREKDMLWQS
jgi:hypothetical protein